MPIVLWQPKRDNVVLSELDGCKVIGVQGTRERTTITRKCTRQKVGKFLHLRKGYVLSGKFTKKHTGIDVNTKLGLEPFITFVYSPTCKDITGRCVRGGRIKSKHFDMALFCVYLAPPGSDLAKFATDAVLVCLCKQLGEFPGKRCPYAGNRVDFPSMTRRPTFMMWGLCSGTSFLSIVRSW